MNKLESAIDKAVEYDPIQPFAAYTSKDFVSQQRKFIENIYKDIIRRAKQSKLTDFFESKRMFTLKYVKKFLIYATYFQSFPRVTPIFPLKQGFI